jgi:uncharacterized protein YdaU (DUF1376 family)
MNFYKHHLSDYTKATAHLSILEHGVYLLMLHHHYATEAPLPANEAVICRIIRATSKAEAAAVRLVLAEFWTLTPDGWINDRAVEEIHSASELRELNSEKGKLGGRPKKGRAKAEKNPAAFSRLSEPEAEQKPSQTPDSRLQTKGEPPLPPLPPDGGDDGEKPPDPFAAFWAAYPRKVGKEAARKAWLRLPRPADTLRTVLAALQWQRECDQWTRDNGQFVPNPATYLRQQRWLDEPPRAQIVPLTSVGQRNMAAAQRWLESQEASA